MKRLLAGAALLACVGSPAYAATFYSWQGDLFVTAINSTANCNAVGMHVGDFARGVFRPKGLGSNGTIDVMSWHFSRSSGQIAPSPGPALNGATKATVRTIFGSGGFNQIANVPITATVAPASPAISTPIVTLTVTITDIYTGFTQSNCDITFKGKLAKRPI